MSNNKQISNSTIENQIPKSELMALDTLEEEEERRVLLAASKLNRIRIVKEFRRLMKQQLTDQSSNQKILRIQAWFSDQGLSPVMVSHWNKNDEEFKAIYEEGRKYFAELNSVGAQLGYVDKAYTQWLLPYLHDDFKKHAEWHATLKQLANMPQYTQDQIMNDIKRVMGLHESIQSPTIPTTTD